MGARTFCSRWNWFRMNGGASQSPTEYSSSGCLAAAARRAAGRAAPVGLDADDDPRDLLAGPSSAAAPRRFISGAGREPPPVELHELVYLVT